jgi:LysM repeat protein
MARSAVLVSPWLIAIGAVIAIVSRLLAPSVGQSPLPAVYGPDLRPPEVSSIRPATIAAPLPDIYVVEDGDTLFDIAADFDTSVTAIALANDLDDLNFLELGQEIVVPPPGSARQPVDPALTLTEVAASYGLDAAVLASYNAIAADLVDQPIAREVLLFPPGVRPLALAEDESLEEGVLTSIPFGAERVLEPFLYRVRPGDTLIDVAWRLGIDLDTIVNNNGDLVDADRIRIGDELMVLPISGLLYHVEDGDTLAGIAAQFGLELDPILEFNSLDIDSDIEPGKDLVLPGAGPTYAPPAQLGLGRLFVPYRSQLDGTPWAGANCGPTSLGMGLGSLGINVSSTELRRQVLNAQGMWGNNVGTLLDALARVASSNGARPIGLLDGNRIARWSPDDVRGQLRAGRPVIAQVRFRALPGRSRVPFFGDHYIVLTGLSGDSFLYNDPLNSDGPGADRLMTAAQLETAMNATDQRYAYAAFALAR